MKTQENKLSFRRQSKRDFLWMLISASLCFVTNTLLMLIPQQTSTKASYMSLGPIWLFVYVCIMAPLIEEFLCRYCLYNGIKHLIKNMYPSYIKMSAILATIFSSLVFALLHGSVAQIIYASIFGLLFCIAYETESNIGVPILMHFTANLLSFLLNKYVTSFSPAYIIIDPFLIASAVIVSIILIRDAATVTSTSQH